MSVWVGLWSVCNGWLLVDGARWYGVWVGGLLVVVGWGGRGWVLCWLGVRASLWVVWVLRVCAVWPLRFLTLMHLLATITFALPNNCVSKATMVRTQWTPHHCIHYHL